jgi:hypothetical protein
LRKILKFGLLVLTGSWLVLQGCTKNMADPPSGPSAGPGTPTATVTFTPLATAIPVGVDPGIFCLAQVHDGMGYAVVAVNDATEPSAGVTLTTPNGDVQLPFSSDFMTDSSQFQNPIVYQPGGVYTIHVATSIGTVSCTLSAPAGTIYIAPDGSTASWTEEGTNDAVVVQSEAVTTVNHITYNSAVYTSDLSSPFTIPAEAYPIPGTYIVSVLNANMTFNFTGTVARSAFSVGKSQAITIVK